ncbi:MAG: transcriptional regulator [Anaerolineae bacterium]|nr:DegT/DnrJ/EryC1/StrS family aminotransferase [Anaerolineales bacterium]MCQ3974390.1 transcriptional regulator [Anaerolineae bacterium]
MISVPLLDLKPQYAPIKEEIQAAINRVCDSQYFIMGPEVSELESELAAYCQTQFALGVSSGTDALILALMAIDLKPGDEVITTPYTFFATAGSVARLGATAVFADIDPQTYNLDPAQLEAKITPKTRAIIPVHLYGQCADMDPIMEIAQKHNLYVIEDAAQAIGSEYKGRRAGSIGHIGCFSFFPSKNLGAFGDGGAVSTNDPELAEQMRILRVHGAEPKYYHKFVGGNFRLDALQAAVIRIKLKYLDSWTAGRQRNAARYNQLFSEAGLAGSQLTLPVESRESGQYALRTDAEIGPFPGHRHIYNQYILRAATQRDELRAFLTERKIGTEIYYPVSLHQQECFAEWGGQSGQFPHSEAAAVQTLAVPIYPELTDEQLQAVVTGIAEFYHS